MSEAEKYWHGGPGSRVIATVCSRNGKHGNDQTNDERVACYLGSWNESLVSQDNALLAQQNLDKSGMFSSGPVRYDGSRCGGTVQNDGTFLIDRWYTTWSGGETQGLGAKGSNPYCKSPDPEGK
jgi:hypothetical protein